MPVCIFTHAYRHTSSCLDFNANQLAEPVRSPCRYITMERCSKAKIIVSRPETPMAMPLMAPSISPSCMARLAACDRASTTRALHKMEQDDVIELGYRCMQDIEIGGSLNASVGNSPPRGSRTGNVFSTDGPTARDRQRLFGRARSAVCLQLGKPCL